jgi:hypothetical protein
MRSNRFTDGSLEQFQPRLSEDKVSNQAPSFRPESGSFILMHKTWVRIGQDDRIRQVSKSGSSRVFLGSLLGGVLKGFDSNERSFVKLDRLDTSASIYRRHRGGIMWKPSARGLGSRGEEFPLSISDLSVSQFLTGIGSLTLRNDVRARWLADTCNLEIGPKGNDFLIKFIQTPSIEGCARFTLSCGKVSAFRGYDEFTCLEFMIVDSLGNQRAFALFHDGLRSPWLGIKTGLYFSRVFMISSDGIRVRVVYGGSRQFNIAVFYLADPAGLYSIKWGAENSANPTPKRRLCAIIGDVRLLRILEKRMEFQGTAYDHGRLGAEIAYAAAKDLLRRSDIVIAEPSRGGKDLYSKDGRVVIQARMLVRTRDFTPSRRKSEVSRNLKNLLTKLNQDFHYNDSASCGLAVLTFVDGSGIIKIISCLASRADERTSYTDGVQRALNCWSCGTRKWGRRPDHIMGKGWKPFPSAYNLVKDTSLGR